MKKLVFLLAILLFIFACDKSDDDFSFDGTTWEYSSLKEIEDATGQYTLLERRTIVFEKELATIYTAKSTSFPYNPDLITDIHHPTLETSIYEYVYNYPVVILSYGNRELNLTIHKDMRSLTLEENGDMIVFNKTE